MGRRLLSIAAALALIVPSISPSISAIAPNLSLIPAAQAAPKSPKLTKCNGKERRSANPYGTILPTVDPLAAASVPAEGASGRAGVDVFTGKRAVPDAAAAKSGNGRGSGKGSGKGSRTDPDTKAEVIVPPISAATQPIMHRSC